MRRRRDTGGKAVFKLLLALTVGLYFSLIGFRATPIGVQCPTAPVQNIRVASAVNCACKTGQIRAPKPGDKAFVQCACAEKKEAKAVGSTVKETLGSPVTRFALAISLPSISKQAASAPNHSWKERTTEVPVKPPCA